MEISQSRQSAGVGDLSFARQLARHALSIGFLVAAGAAVLAIRSGAGAHLGVAISVGDLLSARALVDTRNGSRVSYLYIVSDEHLLPASTRDVSHLR